MEALIEGSSQKCFSEKLLGMGFQEHIQGSLGKFPCIFFEFREETVSTWSFFLKSTLVMESTFFSQHE